MQMGDESWQNYHNTVNDLVEKRDAYNMGMMGMIGGGAQDTSANANLGGGGKGTVSLDADDARMYTGQPGVDDGENQSMFVTTPPEPMSEEEKLKREIEETFASIQGMTKPEKIAFIKSGEGKEYQQSLEQLEELLGPLGYKEYINGLFEENTSDSADKEGSGITTTSQNVQPNENQATDFNNEDTGDLDQGSGLSQIDFDIAQKQDEIVNGQDLSNYEKAGLYKRLGQLENDKKVQIKKQEILGQIQAAQEKADYYNGLAEEAWSNFSYNQKMDYEAMGLEGYNSLKKIAEEHEANAEYWENAVSELKMQLPPPPQPPLYSTGGISGVGELNTHGYTNDSNTHPYAEYEINDNNGLSAETNGLFDVSSLYDNGKKYVAAGEDSFTLSIIDAIANGTFPVGTNLMVQFVLQFDGKEGWGDIINQKGDEIQLPYKDKSNLDLSSDCSSFVGNVYELFFGKEYLYGAYTESQFNGLKEKGAYEPSLDELRPGDLIYYRLSERNPNATHVVMYIGRDEDGNDLIIHTYADDNSGTRLHVEKLDDYNSYVYSRSNKVKMRRGKSREDLITGIFRVMSDEEYKSLIVDYPIN